MPRKKETVDSVLKSKALAGLGVKEIKKEGGAVSLTLNTGEMSDEVKRNLANGYIRGYDITTAASNQMAAAPFEAPYFEGITSHFANLTIHDKIRLAMRYFRSEPLVGKIIELMKVFSIDGFRNEHPDPKIKQFYDDWAEAVNIEQVLGWMFLEYYRSGNVVTWRELVPYKKGGIDLQNNSLYLSTSAKKKEWTKKMIPGAYTILNPLTVSVDGVVGYRDSLYFMPPMIDNEKISGNTTEDFYDIVLRHTPKEMQERAKIEGKVPLSQKNVRRVLRMRMPYEPYGSILMERAFASIHEKNKLRQMDLTMVNSVINQIIKVTVGNDTHPATPRQIKALADAFKNVGKSQTIFWNHTLNIEVIRPDTKVLNREKYERIDDDIRSAFGIPAILTGESGGRTNFATAYLSVKAFLANLMEGRRDVLDWLKGEYRDIAEVMGFDSFPEPRFNTLALTDEIAEKQVIMQMLDRGIISYTTAQSVLGYDPQVEQERRKVESKLYEKGEIGPLAGSPYNQAGGQAADNKQIDGKEAEASKTNRQSVDKKIDAPQNNKSGDSGRPTTAKGNYPQSRKTAKIKGQGSEGEVDQLDLPELTASEILDITGEFEVKAPTN
jgi:hypothetical protein